MRFRYPEMWLADQAIYVSRMQARTGAGAVDAEALLRSRKQKGPAALAGFGPPGGGKFENLSVFRSPVMAGLKLRNLGTPTEFAQKLLDTAVAPPESGKKTTLLAATERADGSYAFEYCLQLPPRRDGAEGRILHNLAVASVRGGDELFTLTVLCGEEDRRDREALFRQVAASFRCMVPKLCWFSCGLDNAHGEKNAESAVWRGLPRAAAWSPPGWPSPALSAAVIGPNPTL